MKNCLIFVLSLSLLAGCATTGLDTYCRTTVNFSDITKKFEMPDFRVNCDAR
ncbi:hypothetical protein ACFBZI_11105 [Moraxella sp. ZJ142]|uniref:hypothetical protein n=1 Tax=Moraxella marmotae TaxID=3344520 RepID=UPI0035D49B3E